MCGIRYEESEMRVLFLFCCICVWMLNGGRGRCVEVKVFVLCVGVCGYDWVFDVDELFGVKCVKRNLYDLLFYGKY